MGVLIFLSLFHQKKNQKLSEYKNGGTNGKNACKTEMPKRIDSETSSLYVWSLFFFLGYPHQILYSFASFSRKSCHLTFPSIMFSPSQFVTRNIAESIARKSHQKGKKLLAFIITVLSEKGVLKVPKGLVGWWWFWANDVDHQSGLGGNVCDVIQLRRFFWLLMLS